MGESLALREKLNYNQVDNFSKKKKTGIGNHLLKYCIQATSNTHQSTLTLQGIILILSFLNRLI